MRKIQNWGERESEEGTSYAIAIGATGDGSSEDRNRLGETISVREKRHADADRRGGAAVKAQDDAISVAV